MSAGIIVNWRSFHLAGRIVVTSDPIHEDEEARFNLSDCSSGLRTFLQSHNTPPSVSVTFDLIEEIGGSLRARRVDSA